MTVHNRRHFLKLSAGALAAPALRGPCMAQAAWPAAKPIRAIVPFSAGSTIDIIGRIVLEPLSRQLGQTIVVENRGGAGGSLGSAAVAKADPDGYTLLINAAAHSGAPAAYANLPYDAAADFAGVAVFGSVPNVLLVAPSKGIRTVQELVAKAKDGSLTFASAGVGSATHWAAERFIVSAGFKATHVPFRGGPEALTEVMTGRVDFIFIGISSGLPFIQNKQLVPLAVSSAKRSPTLPDVPTTLEAGYKDFRLQLLERNAGTGKNAGAGDRTSLRRDDQGARTTRGSTKIDHPRRRTCAAQSKRNGRDDPARDRTQPQDSERSRTQIQLSTCFRALCRDRAGWRRMPRDTVCDVTAAVPCG